jgi:hypothetical protein
MTNNQTSTGSQYSRMRFVTATELFDFYNNIVFEGNEHGA